MGAYEEGKLDGVSGVMLLTWGRLRDRGLGRSTENFRHRHRQR